MATDVPNRPTAAAAAAGARVRGARKVQARGRTVGRVMTARRGQAKGTAVVVMEEMMIAVVMDVVLLSGSRRTLIRFCNIHHILF